MLFNVHPHQPTSEVLFPLLRQSRESSGHARRVVDRATWRNSTAVSQTALQEARELEQLWTAKGASTTRLSQHAIQSLERFYVLRGRSTVLRFLEHSPFLLPILLEAWSSIKNYFPRTPLFLEVVTDPEAVGQEQLVIFIPVHTATDEASQQLDRLDDDWWLEAVERTQGKLCITLEFT